MAPLWHGEGAACCPTVATTFSSWKSHVKECVHVQALKQLHPPQEVTELMPCISHVSDMHVGEDGYPTLLRDRDGVPFMASVSAAESGGMDRAAVMFSDHKGYVATCTSCNSPHQQTCRHVSALQLWRDTHPDDLADGIEWPSDWTFIEDDSESHDGARDDGPSVQQRDPISFEKVPIDFPPHINTVLQQRMRGIIVPRCHDCQANDMECHHCIAQPTQSRPTCSCGSSWSPQPARCGTGTLLHTHGSWPVEIFVRYCTNSMCRKILPYDGQCDGIFNFSNNYLITYEVAISYTKGMLNKPYPFYAHWVDMCDAYEATDPVHGRQALFSEDTHRYVYHIYSHKVAS